MAASVASVGPVSAQGVRQTADAFAREALATRRAPVTVPRPGVVDNMKATLATVLGNAKEDGKGALIDLMV